MLTVSLQLNKDSATPLYQQLASHLEAQIKQHPDLMGTSLPSIRKLATLLDVNNSTITQAYRQLESKQLIEAKKGSGYFIKMSHFSKVESASLDQFTNLTKPTHELINFASTSPSSTHFPIQSFQQYLNYVLERDQGFAFDYVDSAGYEPLRQSFTDYLKRYQNISLSDEHMQIVSGSQQGLDLLAKTLLEPDDIVMCEQLTSPLVIASFKSRHANIIQLPLTADGLDIDELKQLLIHHKPKFIYTMPTYQNPTTVSYTPHVMKQLLNLANEHDFYIVEEDNVSELVYQSSHTVSHFKHYDDAQRVIYIKSFSKLVMPGLRMGFMIVPKHLKSRILDAKQYTDVSTSGLIQRTLDLYLRTGDFDEYLDTLRLNYRAKYLLMAQKLQDLSDYDVSTTIVNGGICFWVKLPSTVSSDEFARRCKDEGLLLTPGSFFSSSKQVNHDVRLSFTQCEEQEINRGFFIFKTVLKALLSKI